MSVGDLGSLFGGLTGKSKSDFQDGNARYVTYMDVLSNLRTSTTPDSRVKIAEGERQNRVHLGDVLFTGSSETPEDVGLTSVATEEPAEPLYLNSFCFGLRLSDPISLHPEFAKHLFRSSGIREQIVRTASGVTRFNVSKARLRKVLVPIPPMSEQVRIAGLLDRFDALVNDLSVGLPAELAARRQQYEHYRDRLLTFPEAA
jgi:type I restriction enzyme S subunit